MARSRYPLGSELEFLDRAPGWWFHGVVISLAVVTLWQASLPSIVLHEILWVPVGLVWIARVTIYNYRHMKRDRPLPARSRLHWSIAPAIVSPVALLLFLGVPLRLRFEWSREAFERAAADVTSIDVDTDGMREQVAEVRIGLYDVVFRDAVDGGARFEVAGGALSPPGRYGFARFAGGPPPAESGQDSYVPLVDQWYLWFGMF